MKKKPQTKKVSPKGSARRKASKKKRKKRSSKPDSPLFTRLVLRGIHLNSLNAVRDLRSNRPPEKTNLRFQSSLHHGDSDNPKRLMVEMTITIEAVNSKDPTSRLTIEATHHVFYEADEKLPKSIPEEDSRAITSLGAFVSWPYVRELASSMTSKMGLPAMLLPSLRGNIEQGQIEVAVPK